MQRLKPETSELTDAELIRSFVVDKSDQAFETLVRRHYNIVFQRLLSITHNRADAEDLAQKLWLKVLEYLPKYKEKQKFAHFLNTVATNLLKDEWRKKGIHKQTSLEELLEQQSQHSTGQIVMLDEQEDVPDLVHNRREVDFLIKTLVPNLNVKLRSVFILRHESEYWDGQRPFQWQHLAELNNLETKEVYHRFIGARDELLTNSSADKELDEEDRLIFIAWTQAQRLEKGTKQTESYLAKLLNIPVNTFKTRYRAALSQLAAGLEQWRGQQHTA